jgi:hypothetical protein
MPNDKIMLYINNKEGKGKIVKADFTFIGVDHIYGSFYNLINPRNKFPQSTIRDSAMSVN